MPVSEMTAERTDEVDALDIDAIDGDDESNIVRGLD